jgi:hypothetical protein
MFNPNQAFPLVQKLKSAPRLEKGISSNLGGQFATLDAKVPAFISKLGPNNKPKMLKVGP